MTLLAGGLAFLVPIFVLALVPRVRTWPTRGYAGTAGSPTYSSSSSRSCCPPSTPSRSPSRSVPLLLLYELSIWLAVLMERRWQRNWDEEPRRVSRPVRILSADWVVPVEGPRAGGRRRDRRRRPYPGSRHGERAGARRALPDSVILPGFVNAHSHLEYAVYAGFGDGLPFAPWIAIHVQRKAPHRLRRDGGDLARVGARSSPRSRGSRLLVTARFGSAAAACAGLGLRAIVYLEVFGASESARALRGQSRAVADSFSDQVRLGISPHAPYTCCDRALPCLRRPGAPGRDAPRRERGRAGLPCQRATGPGRRSPSCSSPPLGRARSSALADAGVLDPDARRALRLRRREEILSLGGQRRRRRPLSALERLSRLRHRPAERASRRPACGSHRHRQPRVDTVLRHVRGDAHGVVGPPCPRTPPGRAHGCGRARAGDARAARARSVSTRGRLARPGKQADITVLSLGEFAFLPLKIPLRPWCSAGPLSVTATLVSGEDRYRKGATEWHELTDAARNARSRMLQ